MEIFARQISSALHNNQLHLLVSEQNQELTRAYAQLNESYMEIIGAMRTIVDEAGHLYKGSFRPGIPAWQRRLHGRWEKIRNSLNGLSWRGCSMTLGKVKDF